MFGQLKQNLSNGQCVRLGNTNSLLDGIRGRIIGKSFIDIADAYMVLLIDKNPYNDDPAINITEACIEPYDPVDYYD